jgi:hypothetical protein
MYNDEKVIVDKSALVELENARIRLVELIEEFDTVTEFQYVILRNNVTSHMWEVANTKWPEYKEGG